MKTECINFILVIVIAFAILSAGVYVWSTYKVTHSINFVFEIKGRKKAQVLINGEMKGETPLHISYEKIKTFYLPELAPTDWPPSGTSGQSESISGFQFQFSTTVKDAEPAQGQKENIIYVRERQGTEIHQGAFRVKVIMPTGKPGIYIGGGSSSHSNISESVMVEKFIFDALD